MPPRYNGLLRVKGNEKTLVKRKYNKGTEFRKTEDDDWRYIEIVEDCWWQKCKKPEERQEVRENKLFGVVISYILFQW